MCVWVYTPNQPHPPPEPAPRPRRDPTPPAAAGPPLPRRAHPHLVLNAPSPCPPLPDTHPRPLTCSILLPAMPFSPRQPRGALGVVAPPCATVRAAPRNPSSAWCQPPRPPPRPAPQAPPPPLPCSLHTRAETPSAHTRAHTLSQSNAHTMHTHFSCIQGLTPASTLSSACPGGHC